MTTPSSTSQSVLTESFGSTTASLQPTSALVGFMKMIGSFGIGEPVSAAWSE